MTTLIQGVFYRRLRSMIWASLAVLLLCTGLGVNAQVVYYHNDISGSPLAATDEAGNLLWRESYRPYGDRILKPAAANTQWFHGKPLDADTGMQDFGARNYDAVLGRFLSIDPVDFVPDNIHSFNRYNYGNNNPLKYKDPDGRFAIALVPLAIDAAVAYVARRIVIGTAVTVVAKVASDATPAPATPTGATPEPGTPESSKGCIYRCDGVSPGQRTPSGKPYVGSADDKDARAKGAKDGREREGATVVGEYDKGDRKGRQEAEQNGINESGGKENLDNRRNEVAERKWEERNIKPPNKDKK